MPWSSRASEAVDRLISVPPARLLSSRRGQSASERRSSRSNGCVWSLPAERRLLCRFLDAGGITSLLLRRPASKSAKARSRGKFGAGWAASATREICFRVDYDGGREAGSRATWMRAEGVLEAPNGDLGGGVKGMSGRSTELIGVVLPREIACRRRGRSATGTGKRRRSTNGLGHDVSLAVGVGRHLGSRPPKTSMTIMRAPQCRHGLRSARGASGCDIRLLLRVGGRRVSAEQCANCCDVLGAVGVGEEPVVADAVEAPRQHVHEKAADELVRVKPHRLPASRPVDAIILQRNATWRGRLQ